MGQGTNQIANRAEAYTLGQTGTLSENLRGCTYTQAAAYGLPVTGSNQLVKYSTLLNTTKPFVPYLSLRVVKSGSYDYNTTFTSDISTATWYTTESAAKTGTVISLGGGSWIDGRYSSEFPHNLNLFWTYNNTRYRITRVYCRTQEWAVGTSDFSLNQTVNYVVTNTSNVYVIIKDNNTSKYTALRWEIYHG